MDHDTQKLTSALADPTRFSIYQFVATQRHAVTVQEIADQFTIHPNVARLHLSKLEDVDLLKSVSDKSGRGGRPSRLYSLSDQVVNLQFPPRDYRFLADIAIEALLSLGAAGEAALIRMGHQMGQEAAKRALAEQPLHSLGGDMTRTLEHIQRLVVAQGLKPEIELIDATTLKFRVFNCTFQEATKRFSGMVCKMHNALLQGIFEVYFGEIELREEESMLSGCQSCTYTIFRVKQPLKQANSS